MQYFLAKTEPSVYSIDDLSKKGNDLWDGVTNPVALKNIKQMKVGDRVLIYHSGKNPAIVGLAKVVGEAEVDPKNPKSYVPIFAFVKKFDQALTLAEIKKSHLFDDWALIYQGRLSTMSVPEKFVSYLKKIGFKLD